MDHSEVLGLFDEYSTDRLPEAAAAAVKAHLDACPDCRTVVARWHEGYTPDMAPMVMARVAPMGPWRWALPQPVFAVGLALSLLVLGLAFWHPEAAWLHADGAMTADKEMMLRGGL